MPHERHKKQDLCPYGTQNDQWNLVISKIEIKNFWQNKFKLKKFIAQKMDENFLKNVLKIF